MNINMLYERQFFLSFVRKLLTTELIVCYVTVLLVVYIMKIYTKKRRLAQHVDKFPGPRSVPIFGNILPLARSNENVIKYLRHLVKRYPDSMRFWILWWPYISVCDPQDIQIVLNHPDCLHKDNGYNNFKNTFGDGLLTAPVEKWRKNRRAINPAFNMKFLEQFLPVFTEKNKILIENLKKEADTGQHFDILNYIMSANLDIICETAMGHNLGMQQGVPSEYAISVIKSFELDSIRIYKPWLQCDIIFYIYRWCKGHGNIYKTIRQLPMQVIQKRKRELQDEKLGKPSGKPLKTFLDLLLELNETTGYFDDTQIVDEVFTMLIGEKVYEEIKLLLAHRDKGENLNFEDINQLTYLEQCIKETMRLSPVAPILLRKAGKDIELADGKIIPEGCGIAISPIKVQHNKNYYKNPMTWNPENFSPSELQKRHRYTFIPFSGGPRGCIGVKYAMISMKLMIYSVVANYHLSTDTKMQDIQFVLDIILRSKHGYPIQLKTRTI